MKAPRLYGHPVLMKAGLGNMLVPWAKCVLWCKDHDVPMIAPYWTKLRIGPFLRFEKDKRQYQFLFHHADQIAGLRRVALLASARSVDASEWRTMPDSARRGRIVVAFRNMDGTEALAGRHQEVADALYRITRPRFVPRDDSKGPFIAVHVRMGDFRPATATELRTGAHCRRIPVEWYADAVLELRRALGTEMEARVFCDGPDAELRPLIELPRVSRVPSRSAITDMLSLARSSVLVASGSAFSMWGSYLGGTPAVWYPGQRFAMRPLTPDDSMDAEWDRDRVLNVEFIRSILDRASRAPTLP